THNAARTLHLGAEDYGFGVGRPASFILLDAATWYEALSFNAPVVASYRDGRQIVRTAPASTEILF
ncbi:MAG TPA: cytosine deaminase, partial [Brevibacterium sp.]|nr:cytosine deaminase [Brevibacterium sp.]